ncbi:DUF1697 domain-containing protein [Janibacter cremeus]|uniref:DUF1697 domain-containing protein n=1 Tax=Janibacter cremeus TaxID=1285192 RepID=UPI0023F737D5|nr:DUF1697 domain-containing protein [Janibacter cremeus]WEV77621.1 DUF1697 domain-containing protein [Janibacter cremeus]
MPAYVAFLRAINLGARRKFPKADLQRVVESVGTGVQVHLNTGNVLLTSRQRSTEAVARTLERSFAADRGFEVPTVVLTLDELAGVAVEADAVAGEAPFAVGAHYVSFLREEPGAEAVAAFTAREAKGETAVVRGRTVHLMVAEGGAYHAAKLPAAVERDLGVATNRNLTVVRELARRWT